MSTLIQISIKIEVSFFVDTNVKKCTWNFSLKSRFVYIVKIRVSAGECNLIFVVGLYFKLEHI